MLNLSFVMMFEVLFILSRLDFLLGRCEVPVLSLDPPSPDRYNTTENQKERKVRTYPLPNQAFLPFLSLIKKSQDTSEYWRETEILTLVRDNQRRRSGQETCKAETSEISIVRLPSRRTVRPICRNSIDYQLCPQCAHFSNYSECELFRDSCRERRVHPTEQKHYCDRKYGKWSTMFIPADYTQCRCCDECVFYRELDQSCMADEYNFDTEEFLPVTTIDFRAGCNPYWGHPEQESRALKCDKTLRRCVPVSVVSAPNENLHPHRNFRFEPTTPEKDCPQTCRGYVCRGTSIFTESQCSPGAFLPDKNECNCCGRCSVYYQLDQKCAEFQKTVHLNKNGTKEIEVEVEEEFLEPGCDDGLVCRQGICQDIHVVQTMTTGRRKRDQSELMAFEPCKREIKYFKKKYGPDGHLHFEAPQCTPLWLYAPVQCRRFVCYCALEDGTIIEGIKVPRVEVSNMNCDCAREKCRLNVDVECDGYGNYKEASFTPHVDEWGGSDNKEYDDILDDFRVVMQPNWHNGNRNGNRCQK